MLKDPLNAFQLRHLEQDIAPAAEGEPPAGPYEQGPPPIMIWPEFESGFGDVIMWTLLPLGWLLATGALPNGTLMISGALFTRSWEPLTAIRNVCTTERYDRVEDQRVVRPLPRCAPRCYERVEVCDIRRDVVRGPLSYRARAALDASLGFATPTLPPHGYRDARAAGPFSGRRGELRVLFSERRSWHGRHLTNTRALVRACNGSLVSGWRLRCEGRSLSSGSLADLISLMRATDVFVSMHGGDMINALHMLPGRTVIEAVNHGFHKANDGWLNHFRLHLAPTLRHKRVVLPPVAARRAKAEEVLPTDAWNSNGSLPLVAFAAALQSTVEADDTDVFLVDGGLADGRGDGGGGGVATHNLSRGLTRGHYGYCDVTAGSGDCERGSKGEFTGLRFHEYADCFEACRACRRCNFVSVSFDDHDCSWYHSCDLANLGSSRSESHTTFRVAR